MRYDALLSRIIYAMNSRFASSNADPISGNIRGRGHRDTYNVHKYSRPMRRNGKRERERCARQIAKGSLKAENGLEE